MPVANDQKEPKPCGEWVSPLTADDVTGSSIGLHDLAADGDTLYWLEARPSENGRSALVRRAPNGEISDVTPEPINVASRVHEYGGGAYEVDDGRIIYSEKSDNSVWLIEGDSEPRQIVGISDCRYADFRFVPNSDKIVCIREDHRDRSPTDPEAAIVMLDTDENITPENNEGTVLTKGPDFLSSPRPSEDGKELVWISWEHPDMPWDATQLHRAELNGDTLENARIIAGAEERESIVQPEWKNGDLYFCTDHNDWWNIYKQSESGSIEAVTRVTDGEIGGPHWVFGIRYYDFMDDGTIIASLSQNGKARAVTVQENGTVQNADIPPTGDCPVILGNSLATIQSSPVAMPSIVIKEGGKAPEIIKEAGPALLDEQYVSIGEAIAFPTADGEDAHAFYYAPKNADYEPEDGEKPPLVIMLHGGPTSSTGTGFSSKVQWWTSRGFAVADLNYRGSTGYGRPYRQKLDGQWGVADVEDCDAVVDYLVKEGLADPDRVAIRGGSAGGFTVLGALTTSDKFKAGASLYGIGDLMLLAAETHKFESRYIDRLVGPLPESEAIYRDRSAINHLDNLTAGIIFFQGLDDKVVPPSQAQTMVDAMVEKNLPVAHYEFEGEGHGFRKSETQKRVLDLELGFYGKMFGFEPPGVSEQPEIKGTQEQSRPTGTVNRPGIS